MNWLSYNDIEARAPAAFAPDKAAGLSKRYSFISTRLVIDRLGDNGWYPVAAYQGRSKDPLHTTHMITFRTTKDLEGIEVGDLIPQIMFINNHAGRKSAELPSGFERLACKNGLTVASGIEEGLTIQIHTGNAEVDILAALEQAQAALRLASNEVQEWQGVVLNGIEQLAFAGAALGIRYPEAWLPILSARPLLERRREADQNSDLWTVFNVVQENLTQGGGSTGVFSPRRRLRKVTGVTPGQKINKGLWGLARRFARMFRKVEQS